MARKIQYDQYNPVVLYELRQFFNAPDDADPQDLIHTYRESNVLNKTQLWIAVSKQLKISSSEAYKYFINTWTRLNLNQWPKELKVQLKEQLNKKINNEFQPGQEMTSYRKKTLNQFMFDMKIKENQEYQKYYYESLYYYLYNNITSQLCKLSKIPFLDQQKEFVQKHRTQIKNQEVKDTLQTVQQNCQNTIVKCNINLTIPTMTSTGIGNIDQSQLIYSNLYKIKETISVTQSRVQFNDQTSDSITDEFNNNLSAQETSYIAQTGMEETQHKSLQIYQQDEINLYPFDLKSTDSSADQDFTGCYNSMKEQVQEQLEIDSFFVNYFDDSFVGNT